MGSRAKVSLESLHRRHLAFLSCLLLIAPARALAPLEGVANFRLVTPLVPGLYRCAELERASDADADFLLNELGVRTIVDLRNDEEVAEARRTLSGGGQRLVGAGASPERVHLPPLGNIDAFFDAVAASLPAGRRLQALAWLLFDGGKRDQLLRDELTREGTPRLLYTSMLQSAPATWGAAFRAATSARPAVVHCAKGKDRTGVLAALVALAAGEGEAAVVEEYARSAGLLTAHARARGEPGGEPEAGRRGGMDWSALRGTPPEAMEETLAWLRREHGSVDGYLDRIGVDAACRAELRGRSVLSL